MLLMLLVDAGQCQIGVLAGVELFDEFCHDPGERHEVIPEFELIACTDGIVADVSELAGDDVGEFPVVYLNYVLVHQCAVAGFA